MVYVKRRDTFHVDSANDLFGEQWFIFSEFLSVEKLAGLMYLLYSKRSNCLKCQAPNLFGTS